MKKSNKNKFMNQAIKIVDKSKDCLSDIFKVNNNILYKQDAIRYFSLCFYPDYKIKFVEGIRISEKHQFGPSDIMFNGDIIIGIVGDLNFKRVRWFELEDLIEIQLKRRNILKQKSMNKMFNFPFNTTIRTWCMNNFSENVISANAELQEFGNTQTGAIYKLFLDDDDELRLDFFKELGNMYKSKIYAEL